MGVCRECHLRGELSQPLLPDIRTTRCVEEEGPRAQGRSCEHPEALMEGAVGILGQAGQGTGIAPGVLTPAFPAAALGRCSRCVHTKSLHEVTCVISLATRSDAPNCLTLPPLPIYCCSSEGLPSFLARAIPAYYSSAPFSSPVSGTGGGPLVPQSLLAVRTATEGARAMLPKQVILHSIQPCASDTACEQTQYRWGTHNFIFVSAPGLSYLDDVPSLLERKGTSIPPEKCMLSYMHPTVRGFGLKLCLTH